MNDLINISEAQVGEVYWLVDNSDYHNPDEETLVEIMATEGTFIVQNIFSKSVWAPSDLYCHLKKVSPIWVQYQKKHIADEMIRLQNKLEILNALKV